MSVSIRDSSTGRKATVSPDFQLVVQAENLSINHFISAQKAQAYQVIGDHPIANAGTKNVLHVQNNSPTLSMVITYIRVQAVALAGGAALPNAANFFELGFGLTYGSAGSAVLPVNCNQGSGNTAGILAYDDNPTLAGAFLEADRFYPQDAWQEKFSKEGAWIMAPQKAMTIRATVDHTSGLLYARASFLMMDLRS
jgi:hypothetical protein